MKLEEGRSYKFIPARIITLPDSNDNLILNGPDGKKYLLPLSFYTDYNLNEKTEIICKIDKINCSGKVFLEPQHPFYREGEYYMFVIEMFIPSDDDHESTKSFVVRDLFGNQITAPVRLLEYVPEKGSQVRLKVERISKGHLHFSKPGIKDDIEELTEGEYYDFLVKRTEFDSEGEEHYIVTDVYNKEHNLPVRYYSHYGFKTGETFRGKVIRYSAGKQKTIEPENPWYAPGDIVEVTVGNYSQDETGILWAVEVYDNKGFSYSVKCRKKPVNSLLKCEVLKIRKGRPVLVPLEDK